MVHDDTVVLLESLRAISLVVKGSKFELTILNDSMQDAKEALFTRLFLGVGVVEACDLSLLGAPMDIQAFWELGGLGCRRAGDIALHYPYASMNYVGELVETILSRINIADTNKLLLLREVGKICCVRRIKCLEPDYWPRHRKREPQCFAVFVARELLESESVRVVIALRVGADVCIPHSCRCGGRMDSRGLHGWSCKYSAGRFSRHSAMNDLVKRALQKARMSSVLEHPGLDRGDDSHPDGTTVFPFSGGGSLVWDARVLILLLGYTCLCQLLKLAQLQTSPRSASAVNTLPCRGTSV